MARYLGFIFFCLCSILLSAQPQGSIYFTDASNNLIFKWQDNKIDTIISKKLGFPWRLATNGTYLYWTSVDKNLVERSKLDGSTRERLAFITYPEGISINPRDGTVFISEAGTPAIFKLKPPKYLLDTIHSSGLIDPDNILFNNNNIYWLDAGLQQISKSSADGTKRKVILDGNDFKPLSITVDKKGEFLYWADEQQKGIFCLDLTTLTIVQVVADLPKVTGIALSDKEQMLIWLDVKTSTIGWQSLNRKTHGFWKIDAISDFHGGILYIEP